jgi:hypothetical protein
MGDYEDFDACVADNQDKRDPEAYCAAIKRQIEGAAELSDRDREVITASDHYSDRLLDETPCWDNYTMVGTKTVDGREVPNCVPDDDVPDANLAAADDRCGEGKVRIGNRCVDLSRVTSGDDDVPPSVLSDGRMLAEFDAGDAVSWSWQGETVHGRVSEINEEQATVGDVTIEGDPDDEEPVYVIDEYDDEAGGFRSSNVAKPESSLNESQRDLPDRTEDNMLAAAQHLQLKSLESEPIERVEDGGDTVRYRNLKLLSPGIWADAGSQTETYYPPEGIAALQAHYDESEHDGPPLNIMHDLDAEEWDHHEASVAGHVDPKTLDTDDDGNLFGDIVVDTSTGAGQFADENLRSTLEKGGTVGFGGPSVEIPAEGLQQSHDPQRDMPRVDGGRLTGVALVMDPASKSVNFARESARRPVALAAGDSGQEAKVLTREQSGMSDRELADAGEVREIMEMFGFDTGDLDDGEVMDMAEDLHEDLMDELQGGDTEMGDYGDDEDDDEEDDDEMEMADDGMDADAMQEQVTNLMERVEDLEDTMSQAMTSDEAQSQLASADTVEELEAKKEELDRRLSELEDAGAPPKTLADADDDDTFDPEYDTKPSRSSGW